MILRRRVQSAHRWLGLILALQVVAWMASGGVMSWFPLALVRGETNAAITLAPELDARAYASPGRVISQADGAHELQLTTWLGRPVYRATTHDGAALFDAISGERLSPIGEKDARRVAELDYVRDAEIAAVRFLNDPPAEYRGPRPVWRADFDDAADTRLYISPETGAVVARRNRYWRVYDFFWMLHIMDYGARENFNNPLLRIAAATGAVFALTGLFLVLMRLAQGRYAPRAVRQGAVRKNAVNQRRTSDG